MRVSKAICASMLGRVIALLLASILAVCAQAGVVHGEDERLTLFVADEAAPKMFLRDGKPVGYMTELAIEAMRRAGYSVDVQAVPWARAVAFAQNGKGVITSFSRTPEREKQFVFSDPVYEDAVLMITRKSDGLRLDGMVGLSGYRLGAQLGASFGPAFEAALPSLKVERDEGPETRLRKLLANRIDVALLSGGLPAVRFYAAKGGVDINNLTVQARPLVVDANYFAVVRSRPDAQEIIRRLNTSLATMRNDGTADRIQAGYE